MRTILLAALFMAMALSLASAQLATLGGRLTLNGASLGTIVAVGGSAPCSNILDFTQSCNAIYEAIIQ